MIIPLGHDQLTLRRLPVVCFAIMALCAAVFVAGAFDAPSDTDDAREKFTAALQYYIEHPHLQPKPLLRQALEQGIAAQTPSDQEEIRRRLSAPADPASSLEQDRQQRLDQLTNAWLATLEVGQTWRLGLVPARFSPDRLLTHLFVHAGLLHLLFNMLFLYLCGPTLEDIWGRPVFALFYLAAGVASAGFFVALYPHLAIPLVGASGAIAGCMGAFFVRYPRAQIRLFYLWLFRVGTTTIPAWVALLLWVSGEFASAFAMDHLAPGTGGAGVAHWGHVGGFAFGVLFALGASACGLEQRVEAHAEGVDAAWSEADRALERGDKLEAWRLLRERMLHHPSDEDAALVYGDLAAQLDRSREAAPVMLRLIRNQLDRHEQESALRQWDELRERVPDVVPAVDVAVKLAACILARGSKHEAAALLREALRRVDATTAPQILADLAATAAGADRALAAEAATRALSHPALPREMRPILERLAADAQPSRAAIG